MNERRWTQEHELLATLIEVMDHGNRTLEAAHSRNGRSRNQPIKIPRPQGPKRNSPQMSSVDEVRAFMARR